MAAFIRASLTILRGVRPVARWVLVGFWVLHTALLLGFRTPGFRSFTRSIAVATDGLIQHTLVANGTVALILIAGGLLWVGGLRLRDLGLTRGWVFGWQVLNAILATYLVWALTYLGTVLIGRWGGIPLQPNPAWSEFFHPHAGAAEDSITALFSSALVEELIYRAFLLPQVFLLLGRWSLSARSRLGIALILSQVVFGLNHLPVGLEYGLGGGLLALYLFQVAAVGVIFAALYLQTGNVLIAVGMHALINAPMTVYLTPIDPQFIALLAVLGLVVAWPWCAVWFGHVFTARRLRALDRLARRNRSSDL